MDLTELKEKMDHARSLEDAIPKLPYQNICELYSARRQDNNTFLIYIDENDNRTELTYIDFFNYVDGAARFLANHGLSRGDRIATVSHNHWHTVIHYFAAWILGLVVVPINLDEDDERIEYILDEGKVELAFIRVNYAERIRSIVDRNDRLKQIEQVICGEYTHPFIIDADSADLPECDEDLGNSDSLIVFTSGTTGPPKAVVLTQKNLLEDARSIAEWHKITALSRMMCVLPIHHVNGTVVTLLTPLFAGASTVLNQRFRVNRFFPIIEVEKVEIVSVVPTLLQYLNNYYKDRDIPQKGTLKHIICGAGPLTVTLAEQFEKMFEIPIIHGYGLSETTCYSCFLPLQLSKEEHEKWIADYRYPSIGVPIPANEMQIHDEEGHSLDEKKRGEIVIRGVNVMRGYYNNREANEKAFTYGWFRSGDEGFFINDQNDTPYFFITGRIKELIIRGGVNLAPLEIDEVINRAPGVKSGIAVGFENDWYGEEVGAFIKMEEDADEDSTAIIEYCRKHLPYAKSPKVVIFGDEIPVTSTGKFQRGEVQHLFDEWRDVQFRESGGLD